MNVDIFPIEAWLTNSGFRIKPFFFLESTKMSSRECMPLLAPQPINYNAFNDDCNIYVLRLLSFSTLLCQCPKKLAAVHPMFLLLKQGMRYIVHVRHGKEGTNGMHAFTSWYTDLRCRSVCSIMKESTVYLFRGPLSNAQSIPWF